MNELHERIAEAKRWGSSAIPVTFDELERIIEAAFRIERERCARFAEERFAIVLADAIRKREEA